MIQTGATASEALDAQIKECQRIAVESNKRDRDLGQFTVGVETERRFLRGQCTGELIPVPVDSSMRASVDLQSYDDQPGQPAKPKCTTPGCANPAGEDGICGPCWAKKQL
jgi:hypothetical protein